MRLVAQVPPDAATFTQEVFATEGLDLLENKRLYNSVLAHVEQAYSRVYADHSR